jgi:hypothetical protein
MLLSDRYPYTFMVDWEEVLTNSMTYPERHADLNPYCGDKVSCRTTLI